MGAGLKVEGFGGAGFRRVGIAGTRFEGAHKSLEKRRKIMASLLHEVNKRGGAWEDNYPRLK